MELTLVLFGLASLCVTVLAFLFGGLLGARVGVKVGVETGFKVAERIYEERQGISIPARNDGGPGDAPSEKAKSHSCLLCNRLYSEGYCTDCGALTDKERDCDHLYSDDHCVKCGKAWNA